VSSRASPATAASRPASSGPGTARSQRQVSRISHARSRDPEARPAIVLAAAGTDPGRDETLGIADRLAAPFTDAFARTRPGSGLVGQHHQGRAVARHGRPDRLRLHRHRVHRHVVVGED
jgi:hypothetical protein